MMRIAQEKYHLYSLHSHWRCLLVLATFFPFGQPNLWILNCDGFYELAIDRSSCLVLFSSPDDALRLVRWNNVASASRRTKANSHSLAKSQLASARTISFSRQYVAMIHVCRSASTKERERGDRISFSAHPIEHWVWACAPINSLQLNFSIFHLSKMVQIVIFWFMLQWISPTEQQ